jgi:Nif-specific regulatory protein
MEASDSAARLRLLYELGCAFAARLELGELIPLVVAKCRDVLRAEGVAVLLLDPERQELYFPYVADADTEAGGRLTRLRFPASRGIAGTVLRSRRGITVDDAPSHPDFYPEVDRHTGVTTRAILCVPIASAQGSIGVIQVINPRDRPRFDGDDLAFLETLAGSIGVAIENARLYESLKGSEERLRAQVGALRRDLARRDRFTEMIGSGSAMDGVFRLMESAAASPIAVLIEGETGTGKELVARGVHRASRRGDGPFVAVNCAALPESLLESELFGHRRGAFTGAQQDQRGFFEAASGGTIFLDEVGEMPAAMQAKLLRVLEDGAVTPVGDTRPRQVDVRVIAATNRDLAGEVAAGRFRQDLYYRLSAFPVRLPALRERREDIPLLADHMLAAAAGRHGKRIAGIAAEALELLVGFGWPGNVRELQNEIERAVALACDGERISPAHLSPKLLAGAAKSAGEAPAGAAADRTGPLRPARAAFEARYITEALRRHGGNVSHAARALGLSRVMLQRKMKDYGLR